MQLQSTDFLHKPICISVYRTITVTVQPVLPIVLYGRMLLHISVQCRTGTQLLPQLSTRNLQVLFYYFPTCNPANLPVRCWYYGVQEDAWVPTVFTNQVVFPYPP